MGDKKGIIGAKHNLSFSKNTGPEKMKITCKLPEIVIKSEEIIAELHLSLGYQNELYGPWATLVLFSFRYHKYILCQTVN